MVFPSIQDVFWWIEKLRVNDISMLRLREPQNMVCSTKIIITCIDNSVLPMIKSAYVHRKGLPYS